MKQLLQYRNQYNAIQVQLLGNRVQNKSYFVRENEHHQSRHIEQRLNYDHMNQYLQRMNTARISIINCICVMRILNNNSRNAFNIMPYRLICLRIRYKITPI
ncbi:hypothetical protein BpHYR1_000913 [Brachionus plicatilis]|uniref:Uncharacterized protein n=1 Tax=Brachionus plicatilis TaxID=10195 RepID=A0A3M7T522_BRAPC|nr:hypothetical protein BpHYR1_000913 [Brachionus plicatilis]